MGSVAVAVGIAALLKTYFLVVFLEWSETAIGGKDVLIEVDEVSGGKGRGKYSLAAIEVGNEWLGVAVGIHKSVEGDQVDEEGAPRLTAVGIGIRALDIHSDVFDVF